VAVAVLFAGAGVCAAAEAGASAEYVGGTLASMEAGLKGRLSAADPVSLVFATKRSALRIPYERINLLEYGQRADRPRIPPTPPPRPPRTRRLRQRGPQPPLPAGRASPSAYRWREVREFLSRILPAPPVVPSPRP
jgi:hypothetical protein